MYRTIWKFDIEPTDRQSVKMPDGAKILCVQTQHNKPRIWALVDPEAEKEDRVIETYPTGGDVPSHIGSSRIYIGTYQLGAGEIVFHVFEKVR